MKTAILAAVALILAGCGAEPLQRVGSGNQNVKSEIIARVDGCVIYRVEDGMSRMIYFMRCPVGATFSDEEHSCGKGCIQRNQTQVEVAR